MPDPAGTVMVKQEVALAPFHTVGLAAPVVPASGVGGLFVFQQSETDKVKVLPAEVPVLQSTIS
jgi:hypothetical protein